MGLMKSPSQWTTSISDIQSQFIGIHTPYAVSSTDLLVLLGLIYRTFSNSLLQHSGSRGFGLKHLAENDVRLSSSLYLQPGLDCEGCRYLFHGQVYVKPQPVGIVARAYWDNKAD